MLKWLPIDDVTLINGDVALLDESLERAVRNVSTVFHLAGLTSAVNDESYTRVNVEGTRNVVQAMQRNAPDALLVLCSSLAAAGPARGVRPLNETDLPDPVSPYGFSKLTSERIVEESNLSYSIIRPPAVYGPRDTDILAAFKMALRGVVFRVASEDQLLSLVYVEDLARGFVQAVEQEGRGLYYMTDGMTHTWASVMENISRSLGAKPRIVSVPYAVADFLSRSERMRASIMSSKPLLTPGRIIELTQSNWTCDDTMARLDLEYDSNVSLPEGIRRTAEWYRLNGWL